MNKKDTLKIIDVALTAIRKQSLVAINKSVVGELEERLACQIPESLQCELFGLSAVLGEVGAEAISELFFGYEFLGVQGVLQQYRCFQDKHKSIFGAYFCDESFNVPERYELWVDFELNGEPIDPTVVRNIGAFLPMFAYQGGYLGEVIKPDNILNGFIAIEAHHISAIAPSIYEHLEDLKDGILRGRYFFDEEDLCYSHAWCQRHESLES